MATMTRSSVYSIPEWYTQSSHRSPLVIQDQHVNHDFDRLEDIDVDEHSDYEVHSDYLQSPPALTHSHRSQSVRLLPRRVLDVSQDDSVQRNIARRKTYVQEPFTPQNPTHHQSSRYHPNKFQYSITTARPSSLRNWEEPLEGDFSNPSTHGILAERSRKRRVDSLAMYGSKKRTKLYSQQEPYFPDLHSSHERHGYVRENFSSTSHPVLQVDDECLLKTPIFGSDRVRHSGPYRSLEEKGELHSSNSGFHSVSNTQDTATRPQDSLLRFIRSESPVTPRNHPSDVSSLRRSDGGEEILEQMFIRNRPNFDKSKHETAKEAPERVKLQSTTLSFDRRRRNQMSLFSDLDSSPSPSHHDVAPGSVVPGIHSSANHLPSTQPVSHKAAEAAQNRQLKAMQKIEGEDPEAKARAEIATAERLRQVEERGQKLKEHDDLFDGEFEDPLVRKRKEEALRKDAAAQYAKALAKLGQEYNSLTKDEIAERNRKKEEEETKKIAELKAAKRAEIREAEAPYRKMKELQRKNAQLESTLKILTAKEIESSNRRSVKDSKAALKVAQQEKEKADRDKLKKYQEESKARSAALKASIRKRPQSPSHDVTEDYPPGPSEESFSERGGGGLFVQEDSIPPGVPQHINEDKSPQVAKDVASHTTALCEDNSAEDFATAVHDGRPRLPPCRPKLFNQQLVLPVSLADEIGTRRKRGWREANKGSSSTLKHIIIENVSGQVVAEGKAIQETAEKSAAEEKAGDEKTIENRHVQKDCTEKNKSEKIESGKNDKENKNTEKNNPGKNGTQKNDTKKKFAEKKPIENKLNEKQHTERLAKEKINDYEIIQSKESEDSLINSQILSMLKDLTKTVEKQAKQIEKFNIKELEVRKSNPVLKAREGSSKPTTEAGLNALLRDDFDYLPTSQEDLLSETRLTSQLEVDAENQKRDKVFQDSEKQRLQKKREAGRRSSANKARKREKERIEQAARESGKTLVDEDLHAQLEDFMTKYLGQQRARLKDRDEDHDESISPVQIQFTQSPRQQNINLRDSTNIDATQGISDVQTLTEEELEMRYRIQEVNGVKQVRNDFMKAAKVTSIHNLHNDSDSDISEEDADEELVHRPKTTAQILKPSDDFGERAHGLDIHQSIESALITSSHHNADESKMQAKGSFPDTSDECDSPLQSSSASSQLFKSQHRGFADSDMVKVYTVKTMTSIGGVDSDWVELKRFLSRDAANKFGKAEMLRVRSPNAPAAYAMTMEYEGGLFSCRLDINKYTREAFQIEVESALKFKGELVNFEQRQIKGVFEDSLFWVFKRVRTHDKATAAKMQAPVDSTGATEEDNQQSDKADDDKTSKTRSKWKEVMILKQEDTPINCYTDLSLANHRASEFLIELLRPQTANIDAITNYHSVIVPQILDLRATLDLIENEGQEFDADNYDDNGLGFNVYVQKFLTQGPLN